MIFFDVSEVPKHDKAIKKGERLYVRDCLNSLLSDEPKELVLFQDREIHKKYIQ
jgi:hypothetical protein